MGKHQVQMRLLYCPLQLLSGLKSPTSCLLRQPTSESYSSQRALHRPASMISSAGTAWDPASLHKKYLGGKPSSSSAPSTSWKLTEDPLAKIREHRHVETDVESKVHGRICDLDLNILRQPDARISRCSQYRIWHSMGASCTSIENLRARHWSMLPCPCITWSLLAKSLTSRPHACSHHQHREY